MKRFFSFIIRQSVAIIFTVLLVLGFGVYTTLKMPINLLPDINVPMVCVQVIYPGANAQSVEKDVTKELEDGLSSISGITDVTSYSYDNLSALVLSFNYGSSTKDKKADINTKLATLKLPSGVSTKVYDIDLNAEALAKLSVTGDGKKDDDGLKDAYEGALSLTKKLQAIDGVERVEIKGGPQTSYKVTAYGGLELISPLIVQSFSYGALDIPLGNVSENGATVQIRNNSDVANEEDIKSMPVTLPAQLISMLTAVKEGIVGGINAQKPSFVSTETAISAVLSSEEKLNDIAEALKQNESTKDLGISKELVRFMLSHDLPAGEMTVKTSEIADVALIDEYSSYAYYSNGEMSLIKGTVVEIYKANGANSSAVVKEAKKVYSDYLNENKAVNITLLDDQSEFITDSVTNVLVSMLIGGALAVVVIFLFLKQVRTSLVVAITMPLSVLAALLCLNLLGITLNMVSLGGLAVGIGMLVDNSIVVIESITKHREQGKSAFTSAVDGTCEVGGALIGSTLTTVCVFIPIILSGGLTGEIFTDLGYAVIFSLLFSLLVAVTVIPALYSLFAGKRRHIKVAAGEGALTEQPAQIEQPEAEYSALEEQPAPVEQTEQPETEQSADNKKKKSRTKNRSWKEPRIMNGIEGFYGKVLGAVLGKKLITLLVALAIFGASVGMLFITGTEFLPSIDKGQIEIDMNYASGVQLPALEQDAKSFADAIEGGMADEGLSGIENIDYISVSVGKNGLLALTDTAIITVQLKTNRHTNKVVDKVRTLAEKHRGRSGICTGATVREIDGVVASLMSGADDMSVTIMGEDPDKLRDIAGEIMTKLEEDGFKDVKSSATDTSLQYTLKFDRLRMQELGIDYQTTVMTLRIGMAGYTACTVTINEREYNLDVSFKEGTITSAEQLENFVIGATSDGNTIKLKDVLVANGDGTAVKIERQEACIRRENGKRIITVSASLGTDTGTATKRMKAVADEVLKNYEGYGFKQSGISEYLSDAFSGLVVALVISFLLLYGVMAIQFSSWVKPLIVMSSIPFSFTGGFLALVITGMSLNVVSFIGLIMLMGVIVNNAIVMLEKIKQLHDGGMAHYDAVKEACKVRLRPIFMTTFTTVLALIPLAIGIGRGSELMQPLGIVVMFGLLIGTLVTLIVVPAVYCAIYGLSKKTPNGRRAKKNNESNI